MAGGITGTAGRSSAVPEYSEAPLHPPDGARILASRRVRVHARPALFARTDDPASEQGESEDARIRLPRARLLLPGPVRSVHSAVADRGVRPNRHRSSSRTGLVRACRPFPVFRGTTRVPGRIGEADAPDGPEARSLKPEA